jgi:hypothetical protein
MFPRVTSVRHLRDYVLELTFSDGSSGQVDWRERLEKANPAGVFGPLRDPSYFAQVELWIEAGTIRWPNGADICPDVLYSEATGKPIPEVGESEPAQVAS